MRLTGFDGDHTARLKIDRLSLDAKLRRAARHQVKLGDLAVNVGFINAGVGITNRNRQGRIPGASVPAFRGRWISVF